MLEKIDRDSILPETMWSVVVSLHIIPLCTPYGRFAALIISKYCSLQQYRLTLRCSVSFVTYDQSLNHCQQKPRKRLFMYLYHSAWPTVTNSLLCGLSDTLLRKLQSVQNAEKSQAREDATISNQCYVSCTGFQFKSLRSPCLVYQSLSRQAHGYLADDCRLVFETGLRALRSADAMTRMVTRKQNS